MKNLIITSILFAMFGCTMFSGPSLEEALNQANSEGPPKDHIWSCSESQMAELVDWVESRPLKEKFISKHTSKFTVVDEEILHENDTNHPVSWYHDGEYYIIPMQYFWHRGWQYEWFDNDTSYGFRSFCIPAVYLITQEINSEFVLAEFAHDKVFDIPFENYRIKHVMYRTK